MVDADITWHGQALTEAARAAGAAALTLAAARVQAVTIPRTPIETGDLRSSLTVVPATGADLESQVTTDSPYAVAQHENLHFQHPNGGQAKYLETALLDTKGEVVQIIAAQMRRALR